MAYKHKNGCKSCTIILTEFGPGRDNTEKRKHSRLYKLFELYHTKGTTLTAMAEQYPISYLALRRHADKHQNPSDRALAKSREKMLIQEATYRQNRVTKHHTERTGEWLDWLDQERAEGKVRPTASAAAALMKQQALIEEKQKDRNVDIMKLMLGGRSGEVAGLLKQQDKEEFDPWSEAIESVESIESIEEGEYESIEGTEYESTPE